MKLAPIPADEAERIADVHALALLDSPRELRFDRLAEVIGEVFDVPRVFITLIDTDRMWFKSTFGVDGIESVPRDVGFCSHAILQPEATVVSDASADERFADNPFVTGDFALRFYAGVPLHGPAGRAVGAVGLVDTSPREFGPDQVALLEKFAAVIEAQLQP
jgi:GAF domain-containing protein